MRLAGRRRWFVRALAGLVLLCLAFVGWNFGTANFAVIEPGQVYRSGQMRASQLARTLRRERIRTVLNLRGCHPDQPWYRDERRATLDAGATQIDIALSSSEWMSRAQARTLLRALDTCDYPLLIHCWRGSERTGLVSALVELLRPDRTIDDARGQFSLRYLFVRAGDGARMRDHLDLYERWLEGEHRTHAPDQVRRWLTEGYVPRHPTREEWPYDPYPLIVVTRPPPTLSRAAGEAVRGRR